jgi:hypothetical protein
VVVPLSPIDDMAAFTATRETWHALGEQVLARARYEATQKIGLRVADDGIATPCFGDDVRGRVTVDGIVREQLGEAITTPITTLAAAAAQFGTPLGAPPVYKGTTSAAPDDLLAVDATSATLLVQWYTFALDLLTAWRDEHAADDPSRLELWPEHFDVAVDLGDAAVGTRATYGASPGDTSIAEPYLYVSPWVKDGLTDPFWNQSFGAALPYSALCAAPDPIVVAHSFLAHGHARVTPR